MQEARGQACPYPDFTVQSDLCINESLQLDNTSANGATTYEWDFCVGDLSATPTAGLIASAVSQPFNVEIKKVGVNYHGFVTDRVTKTLYRLDFGSSLDNAPALVNLNLNLPDLLAIQIVEEEGEWIGFIETFTNKFYRLRFGTSLTSVPTFTELGSFGMLNGPLICDW